MAVAEKEPRRQLFHHCAGLPAPQQAGNEEQVTAAHSARKMVRFSQCFFRLHIPLSVRAVRTFRPYDVCQGCYNPISAREASCISAVCISPDDRVHFLYTRTEARGNGYLPCTFKAFCRCGDTPVNLYMDRTGKVDGNIGPASLTSHLHIPVIIFSSSCIPADKVSDLHP